MTGKPLQHSDGVDVLEKEPHIPFTVEDQDGPGLIDAEQQLFSHIRTHDLTVVIPTRNERDNVKPLLQALHAALNGVNVEIIFVDDSDDDTPLIISGIAKAMTSSTLHIHLEHRTRGPARIGGLATAVDLGMQLAQANYVAVIDADLQHPPAQLRVFYDTAVAQKVDLVLATRYIPGGSYEGLDGVSRRFISLGFKWTAKLLFPEQLLKISDPLGGFFLFRRALLQDVTLRPIGYKILLEILIRCRWQNIVEVPYHFHARANGQSKADMRQGIMALQHMWRLFTEVPAAGRFWKIAGLAAANAIVIVLLLTFSATIPDIWGSLRLPLFAILALCNFFLINHFIFPFVPKLEGTHSVALPISPSDQQIEESQSATTDAHDQQIETAVTYADQLTKSLPALLSTPNPITPIPPSPSSDSVFVDDDPTIRLRSVHNPVTPTPPSLSSDAVSVDDDPTIRLRPIHNPVTPIPPSPSSDAVSVDNDSTIRLRPIRNPITPIPPSLISEEPTRRMPAASYNPITPIPPSLISDEPTRQMPAASYNPITPIPPSLISDEPTVNTQASHNPIAPIPQMSKVSLKERVVSIAPLLIIVLAIGWIIYTLPGAWLILAALFIGLGMLTRNNVNRHRAITMILGIAVGLSMLDYITWRFEVANWAGWWIALPLLGAETLGALHTLGFQYTLWPRPRPRIHLTDDPTRHPIFIFIPTVNEGVAVLEPTLQGAIEARKRYLAKYPHGQVNIVVCNDGFVAKATNWQEADEVAQRLGVQCITRTVGGGAKAGNIENARQQLQATGDTLLVIFDADQVAKPEFLLRTVPAFGDKSVGWVQTGQYYRNLDNPVSHWADDQQSMFYNLLCPGKATINTAFICGTNVVIRAHALDQIGGLPQDSVTEDFSASIKLHTSWRSLFITDVLATGLGPMDLPSYLKQQRRWAIGTLGVLRTHWRELFLPAKNGLKIEQRIQYLLACTHYLCGLRDLIYLLSPIFFILSGIPAVKGSTLETFLWHFLPYFLASSAALWYAGRGLTGLRGIIIGFGCFPVLLESLLSVILQRKVGFAITSKQRGATTSLSYLRVHAIFILVSLTCVLLAIFLPGRQQAAMFISILWIAYSLAMLGGFLWLGFCDLQLQRVQKLPTKVDLDLLSNYPSRLRTRERGLRPVWNLCLALCLAGLIFTNSGIPLPVAPPVRFVVNHQNAARPYLGVSLPFSLLEQRPARLQQMLSSHFAIIGRTQEIQSPFDQSWADQLAQQHERPWITLEFGTFNADGKPPLSASLAAITNGVDDDDLTRWAQNIRNYGKPIYLTVLLHVDRNWSLSSAVTNGGIPQDAPKAWLHIQAVFKKVGTTNVAWVWSPADPAHDNAYAPPASTINCVLLSLISYPDAQWTDPEIALNSVVARYPTKPIILEVSADGPAAQKAAWLTKVGESVKNIAGVHALIYHEGSPSIHATSTENNQWSLLSDKNSLLAMQNIASSVTQTLH